MKGAIDLIALIIIACIVVSMGLTLWSYLSRYYSQVTQSGQNRTSRSLETLSSCMRIEEASQNNFFIRNCGTGLVTNDSLNVYIDDNRFSFSLSPASIDAGKTGTLSIQGAWNMAFGQHSLRITNPNFETSALFEAKLPDSCVLDLEFDEGQGNVTYDSSGYGNSGTLRNQTNGYVVWSNSGYFDKAVNFEGATSSGPSIILPNVQSLNITQPFTIAAWINLKNIYSGHGQPIVSRTSGAATTSLFVDENGQLFLNWGTYNTYDPNSNRIELYGGNVDVNKWHHVVANYYESGLANVYVDGINVGSVSKNVSNYTNVFTVPFRIGYFWLNENSFNGTIDSVRIFNRALTPDQTLNFRLI